ncbi:Ribonuclease Z [Thalassocella blandensis]|nr:Ribonuclease Z [Thalassocella blandensis]
MEFTFLGTSAGVPTKQRNVSALVIKHVASKRWCLVDCGEATQHQLLHVPYSLINLDTIFITHVHGDHCYGLPGLIASAAMAGRTQDLNIVAPKGIEEFVRTTITCTDMHLPFALHFIGVETLVNIRVKSGFKVTAIALSHRVPSYAYRFEELVKDKHLDTEKLYRDGVPQGELWGEVLKNTKLLLGDGRELQCEDYILPMREPRSIVVGGDNDMPGLLMDACEHSQVLIHEATYTQEISDRVGRGPRHSSAKDVAEFAEKSALKNLVLTHFSARYHHPDITKSSSITVLHDEAVESYAGNLFLAEDFANFQLDKDGILSYKQKYYDRNKSIE